MIGDPKPDDAPQVLDVGGGSVDMGTTPLHGLVNSAGLVFHETVEDAMNLGLFGQEKGLIQSSCSLRDGTMVRPRADVSAGGQPMSIQVYT